MTREIIFETNKCNILLNYKAELVLTAFLFINIYYHNMRLIKILKYILSKPSQEIPKNECYEYNQNKIKT